MILNDKLQQYRTHIVEIVKELHQMTLDIGQNELANMVSDLRNRINEPFMFVIVGEVKAGKSSFINALLETDKEVCKVAPDPCTDVIQQIVYGETERTLTINEHLKKIILPVEVLREIAIVDTPGTNTIVKHHQEITERFIPASDLIVFVFESKNPYRQSAWDFFDYIHSDWRKKIIFILQQSDLTEPDDLLININGVKKYALKKGIDNPIVFAVSAKQELNKEIEKSGFLPVREYIRENITGGKAPLLKLRNNIMTSHSISDRIKGGMDIRIAQWNADIAFRLDVKATLDNQEERSNKQVEVLIENLLAGYDKITRKVGDELAENLGFWNLASRSFMSIFVKERSIQIWLKSISTNLENDLNTILADKLQSGVGDIADSIQQMARIIELKIRSSETILQNNNDIFGDIADRRSMVLRDLQAEFSRFINRSESFMGKEVFSDEPSFSPNLATGGGLAVIGAIVAAVTQGIVFDITGGIISAVGFLFAGITVSLKRRKVLADYDAQIKKGAKDLEEEVRFKLQAYIRNIKHKIDQNFENFDTMLDAEETQIKALTKRFNDIEGQLKGIEQELDEL